MATQVSKSVLDAQIERIKTEYGSSPRLRDAILASFETTFEVVDGGSAHNAPPSGQGASARETEAEFAARIEGMSLAELTKAIEKGEVAPETPNAWRTDPQDRLAPTADEQAEADRLAEEAAIASAEHRTWAESLQDRVTADAQAKAASEGNAEAYAELNRRRPSRSLAQR